MILVVDASVEQHGGSLYDGLYVALARSLDVPLITNDKLLAAVARKSGVRAHMVASRLPTS